MFIGFIAVIVVLLIIVAVMSTGTTTGSGGVDQTKAAKMVTEVSALAQTAGFYKTTQVDNNYASVSVANLVTAGIVSVDDVKTVAVEGAIDSLTDVKLNGGTAAAALVPTGNYIKSKAVSGLFYAIAPTTDNKGIVITTAASAGMITIGGNATTEGTAATTLGQALETAYNKFNTTTPSIATKASAAVEGVVVDGAAVSNIGLATIVFK
jgi:hypothetical protein